MLLIVSGSPIDNEKRGLGLLLFNRRPKMFGLNFGWGHSLKAKKSARVLISTSRIFKTAQSHFIAHFLHTILHQFVKLLSGKIRTQLFRKISSTHQQHLLPLGMSREPPFPTTHTLDKKHSILSGEGGKYNSIINYVSGVIGGIAVCLVGHPFDTVKVRLQTQPHINPYYSGMIDCAKKTLKQEGLSGFYAGILSPLLGQMFFRAISFATFHKISRQLAITSEKKESARYKKLFLAGGITGAVIASVETPIDLIKTKLQTQVSERSERDLSERSCFGPSTVSNFEWPKRLYVM